jgi:hypothetical protein
LAGKSVLVPATGARTVPDMAFLGNPVIGSFALLLPARAVD